MVVVDGWYYSLAALVYRMLYYLPFGDLAISIFLAICAIASVYLTALLLNRMAQMIWKEEKPVWLQKDAVYLFAGLVLNLVMPCYGKGLSDGRYIGMQSASIWHNSTYIVMKWLAILSLLAYLKIEQGITRKLQGKDWFYFMLTLALTTGAKPSFLMVFAPVMLVFLLVDLIRGVPFGRLFGFGCAVLPSLGVVLLQNAVLFGAGTGNSWAISPGAVLAQHSGYPLITAALSILFPLMVVIVNLPSLKKDRWYLTAWLIGLVGFLELFLFSETGNRASDGNFMWGYSIAILVLFAAGTLKYAQNVQCMLETRTSAACKDAALHRASGKLLYGAKWCWIGLTALVLLYHLYCGCYFYIRLLQGVSYWMWG
jgi:hypothetical protein